MNHALTFGRRNREHLESRLRRKQLARLADEYRALRAQLGDITHPLRLPMLRRIALVRSVLSDAGALPV